MGNKITSDNLDEIVMKNRGNYAEMLQKSLLVRTNWNMMQVNSNNQLAMQILNMYGLIQIPIDNPDWGGAIFVKNENKIPVINTALSRTNQYFTAWQIIYHLIFDHVSFGRIIEARLIMEEHRAQYFASLMLLGNVFSYYIALPDADFLSKVFKCMDTFQTPYKPVLLALYDEALRNGDGKLTQEVKQNFDVQIPNIDVRFRMLGLDDSIVTSSKVVNVSSLASKINDKIKKEPELTCNHDNLAALENIVREVNLLI